MRIIMEPIIITVRAVAAIIIVCWTGTIIIVKSVYRIAGGVSSGVV